MEELHDLLEDRQDYPENLSKNKKKRERERRRIYPYTSQPIIA
jgi:hypothetical protein